MADFYPLLSRAVSGLPNQTPEIRQAIYERARNALLGQLRSAGPEPDQAIIDAELASLDQAIQRVEAELPAAEVMAPLAPTPPPAPRAPGIIIKPPPPRVPPAAPPAATPSAASPAPAGPEAKTSAAKSDDGSADHASAATVPVQPPQAAPIQRPPQPAAVTAQNPANVSPPAPGANYIPVHSQPMAPVAGTHEPSPAPALSPGEGRPRVSDVPTPQKRRKMGGLLAVMTLLFVAAAAAGGYFAWTKRLLPETFLSGKPLVAARDTAARDTTARDTAAGANTRGPGPADNEAVSGNKSTASDKPPESNVPPAGKSVGRAGDSKPATPVPGNKTQTAAAGEPANSGNSNAAQGIAVAQRAALQIQPLRSDANGKVQNFGGTVVWTTRDISRGAGQPLSFSVRADISIPDAKLKATMTLEKNNDSTLPASHMITWRFQREQDGAVAGISEIGVLQMHDENSRVADPLAGAQAKITPDIYIYALAAPEALRTTNMETLAKRNWFILPIKLSDGREARITMEKGNPGARLIDEAFKKWGVILESAKQ
jgi:hypothetical protein